MATGAYEVIERVKVREAVGIFTRATPSLPLSIPCCSPASIAVRRYRCDRRRSVCP